MQLKVNMQSALLAYSNMLVSENGYSVQNNIGGNLFRLDDEKWALNKWEFEMYFKKYALPFKRLGSVLGQ